MIRKVRLHTGRNSQRTAQPGSGSAIEKTASSLEDTGSQEMEKHFALRKGFARPAQLV